MCSDVLLPAGITAALQGFASQLELQNTFNAGIQFSQSFRESNSGEYPCPGTVVYLLKKCGEQVEQRTLTRTAGYKMLRTHFDRDAKVRRLNCC